MPSILAAEAGLVVNPHSVEDISQGMTRVATNANLRQKLVDNAKLVRQKFSWDKTAELMWQSISRALETTKERRMNSEK